MYQNALFTAQGERKYLTAEERKLFLAASLNATRKQKSVSHVLYYTGCRVTECLNLEYKDFDFSNQTIVIKSIKKRSRIHFRSIPVPDTLLNDLDNIFGIRELQQRETRRNERVWSYGRHGVTHFIKQIMRDGGIKEGAHAVPKGLRHSFAISALEQGVPINLISRWLGHASLETTLIYLEAVGQEEREFAMRMWN